MPPTVGTAAKNPGSGPDPAAEISPAARRALDFGAAWDYAPAPETTKAPIADVYGHFINGVFTAPRRGPGGLLATINPATERKLADVAQGTNADVDAAVRAAAAAQPKWASLPHPGIA
jgi:aldehyde dehydrogenase (NAD+)